MDSDLCLLSLSSSSWSTSFLACEVKLVQFLQPVKCSLCAGGCQSPLGGLPAVSLADALSAVALEGNRAHPRLGTSRAPSMCGTLALHALSWN